MTDQAIVQEPVTITDTSLNAAPAAEQPTQSTPATETVPVNPVSISTEVTPAAEVIASTTPAAEPAVEDMSWKENLKKEVGDDPKLHKIIDKFKSQKDIVTSNAELVKKLSSTRPLPELPENATPEQIKEFREAAGIPEDPTGYELEIEIPEEYKAGLNEYLKVAHANNRPANEVKKSVHDYMRMEEARSTALVQQIAKTQEESKKVLKAEWGINYETNDAVISAFFEKTFGDTAQDIKNAYLPDGTRLADNAKVMSKLLDVSKNTMGAATVIPNNLIREVTGIQERVSNLDRMSLDSSSPYWGANHEQFKKEHDQLRANLADVQKNRR